MKLESINFWFTTLCVLVSHSVCPTMDLGTRCRLNCPLNLSSEQRKVSLEHLSNTKNQIRIFFSPKILVCLV